MSESPENIPGEGIDSEEEQNNSFVPDPKTLLKGKYYK